MVQIVRKVKEGEINCVIISEQDYNFLIQTDVYLKNITDDLFEIRKMLRAIKERQELQEKR